MDNKKNILVISIPFSDNYNAVRIRHLNIFNYLKNNYDVKELESIKGKVMNDYQTSLDEKWIDSLRSNNTIKIDKRVLKSLIKYYRKES